MLQRAKKTFRAKSNFNYNNIYLQKLQKFIYGDFRPIMLTLHLFRNDTADVIDDVVKSIYNETTVLGYGSMVSRRKGYMIMVAVLPKMQRYFTVK
jgi:hypothetical protein